MVQFNNTVNRAPSVIADHLAVDVSVERRFFNELLKNLDVEHQRLIFWLGTKFPTLSAMKKGEDSSKELSRASKPALTGKQRQEITADAYDACPVYTTSAAAVPTMIQVAIPMRTNARGTVYLVTKLLIHLRNGLQVANGGHDVAPGHHFHLLIANLAIKSHSLPKRTVFAYAKRKPLTLFVPDKETAHRVSAVMHIPNTPSAAEACFADQDSSGESFYGEKRSSSRHQRQDKPRSPMGVTKSASTTSSVDRLGRASTTCLHCMQACEMKDYGQYIIRSIVMISS